MGKYVTIADFKDFTVEQPLTMEWKTNQRSIRNKKKKEDREDTISAWISAILMFLFCIELIGTWLIFGY